MKTLKLFLIGLTFLASMPLLAKAEKSMILRHCSNFGDGVSFSFSSCINSNFNQIQSSLGGFYSYCSNYGDEVSFSFLSCVRRNFDSAARELNGRFYPSYCSNYSRERLDFSFISCVNRNFNDIERLARQR